MLEIRRDYILDRYVIIAEKRKFRPREFKKEEKIKEQKVCYFCPGNEKLTPPETGRVENKGKWQIRWFPNKFPFIDNKRTAKNYPYGFHEIIVETPNHKKQLWDLSNEEIKEVLKVYSLRIKDLSKKRNIKYVVIFKNHGREGGTSLIHSHTQVTAINYIPLSVLEEINASHRNNKCLYCGIIKKEAKSKRKIAETKNFVAFCPYASRFNFEAWVFPKRHVKNIIGLDDSELLDLAKVLKKILVKLRELNAPYNFYLHYAPDNKDLHFHIEIAPRIATWGGFEYSTGTVINSVSPEEAAKFYRQN